MATRPLTARVPARVGGGVARRLLESSAGRLAHGELTVVYPDGASRTFGVPGDSPAVTLRVNDEAVFTRLLLHGEIGLGEAYVDGQWETSDLVGLVQLGVLNRPNVNINHLATTAVSRARHGLFHRGRRNTRVGSRENIHAHYDLGNAFFQLFLDESMGYSCPVYNAPGESIAQGHQNKYRALCEMTDVQHGQQILEIGTGWGGFALFAAREYGCRVTTVTISKEQYEYSRALVEREGLADRIDVQLCDYRDVTGAYDRIISIEMLEHVGEDYYARYFRKCRRLLRPGGRLGVQVIGLEDHIFQDRHNAVSWIQKYIYPGATLPSIARLERALAGTKMRLVAVDEIGQHYPVTLQRWRETFLTNADRARELGFDDRAIRMWEYYLATCEACFRTGYFRDLQLVFDRVDG